MTKTIRIGFSAFLKIVCANERPQRRLIKQRLTPSDDGYDFHKSLRHLIRKVVDGRFAIIEAIAATKSIKRQPERNSAYNGLIKFGDWLRDNQSPVYPSNEKVVISTADEQFQVIFAADFVTDIEGRRTAVHVWNTKEKLSRQIVVAALTLVAQNWPESRDRPEDIAVLCLKTGTYYKWSEHTAQHRTWGLALLAHIGKVFTIVRSELGLPPIYKDKDLPRPHHPK